MTSKIEVWTSAKIGFMRGGARVGLSSAVLWQNRRSDANPSSAHHAPHVVVRREPVPPTPLGLEAAFAAMAESVAGVK